MSINRQQLQISLWLTKSNFFSIFKLLKFSELYGCINMEKKYIIILNISKT